MSFVKQIGILGLLAALAFGGYQGWQWYSALETDAGQPASNAGKTGNDGKAGGRRQPPGVETARVEFRDLETRVDAVGSTRARQSVEITPMAPGRVTSINFQPGQVVSVGAVLLNLDDDIERADLTEAKARLDDARSAVARTRSLKQTSAISGETVDRSIVALATAQANHDRAARRLRDRTVNAPFNGTVGYSRIQLGARVEDGDTVTTLDDLSMVEIEFTLPEGLFGRVRPGQRIIADATAYPERIFEGTIETIDSRVDRLSRAFEVRAVVANPEHLLPAGMFMHLAVVLDARRALSVPEEAIVVDGEQTFVYTVSKAKDAERADRRNVSLGQRTFGYVEVVSGLTENEEVIVRGVQRVRDGVPVQRADAAGGTPSRRKMADR